MMKKNLPEQEKSGVLSKLVGFFKDFTYGMATHGMARHALKTRSSMEHLFILRKASGG